MHITDNETHRCQL